jgi:hypothetical protein
VGGLGHDRRLPFIVSNLRDIVLPAFRHRGGPVRARLGFTLGAPALPEEEQEELLRRMEALGVSEAE